MFRTSVKSLLGHKVRLLATALAVLLGVAFMAGTLVLTDTIGSTFDKLFSDANAGTDAYVRSAESLETPFGGSVRSRVDAELVDTLTAVAGVADAAGSVQGFAQIVGADGEAVGNPATGAPTFGGNWVAVDELNPFQLAAGRAPEADDEVVIDRGSAEAAGYTVGDTATVITKEGPGRFQVVGIARFGSADNLGGASYVLFDDETASRLVAEPGTYDAISVVGDDGVAQEELRDALAAAVPDRVEVLTGAEITEENQTDIQEGLVFFNSFLTAFALIALFVGSFMIYNTFSIIVAQRTREMALLRAIGASRRQVLWSVLLEAAVVGLLASVAGLVAGIAVAAGLKALLAGFGFELPAGGLVVSSGTVVNALVTGVLVTVGSAVFPARRASKVPPVAAMRDLALDTSGSSRRRAVAGGALTAVGAAVLLAGLFGGSEQAVALVGAGALAVFFGVAVLGPIIAKPVVGLIGRPLPSLRGVTGTLAVENARRNPRRTASTASALMIGMALVGFITILAASTKTSIDAAVDEAFVGDYVINSGQLVFGGLSPELAARLRELPEVATATSLRHAPAEVGGTATDLLASDPASLEGVLRIGVVEGDVADLGTDGIAVDDGYAEDEGWQVGDEVDLRFAETGVQRFRIAAVYTEEEVVGRAVIGLAAFEANVADQLDAQVYVNLADGVAPEDGRAAIQELTAAYPQAEVQDVTEFKEAQSSQVDALLNLIYALLGFAILIALLGIANTLALSVLERTRELGLLRAVGMTRSQLRSTVRWESVLISLLGTLLGLVIGLFFGWSLVQALAEQGLDHFTLPVVPLLVMTVLAAMAGVVAAVRPAARAAKLDVLRSIAAQ